MPLVSDVVFDVGRVLIDFNYGRFSAKLREHGARIEAAEDFLAHVDLTAYEHGEITSAEFFAQVNALLSQPLDHAEMTAAWNDLFTPIREMLTLAGTLKEHCGVYLLSNTSEIHWQYIHEAFGLDKICHDRLASYEVGAMKPSAEIFAAASHRFDLDPETTVFVDDLEANVKGAIDFGWHGIWHQGVAQTRNRLRQLTGVDL